MEQSKPGKGKEENGERERLSSFLLMWPGSLEINLLELMTAQIQLTEEPVHFGAAWHLPELREGEEVVLPPPSHTGSVQHCTAQHVILLQDCCDNSGQHQPRSAGEDGELQVLGS